MKRGYTKRDENNIIYRWMIEKVDTYLNIIDSTEIVESTKFSSGSKFKDTWCIKAVFKSEDIIGIVLCLLSSHSKSIDTKFSFFILDDKKEKVFMKSYHMPIGQGEAAYLSLSKKELEDNKDQYLRNNMLTVCLDLTVFNDPITTCSELKLKILKRSMTNDYKELYHSKIESDVIINVGDKKFRAHKTILMARSCVLAAMFFNEMIEKKEEKNTISIIDIDPEIFEKVMEYIYTDQVTDLDTNAKVLLEVAEKYQLHSLKEMCQESLSKTLNLENAFKLLIFADLHKAHHLLEFTANFLVLNINSVIDTPDFQQLEKSNPALALKLLKKHSFPKDEN